MILYHGTIGNRGEKIIQDGRIKHDAPLIWDKDISFAVIQIQGQHQVMFIYRMNLYMLYIML